jgi:hypothetical protein
MAVYARGADEWLGKIVNSRLKLIIGTENVAEGDQVRYVM